MVSELACYALAVLAVALITLGVLRWRPDRPLRCPCGRPATRLASDGMAECETCWRMAPRGG